jgi:YcxB-like protein
MITTYFSTKRQLASNKSLNQEHHYIFSYDGIVITTATSSSRTGWDIFREAFETKHNFILFISLNQMYIIPKRCFQQDNQIEQFKAILKDKLGAKAKLK